MQRKIILDGSRFSFGEMVAIANGAEIEIAKSCYKKLQASRKIVEEMALGDEPVYGVNTGFGWLANKKVPKEKLPELQRNIVLSHASGIGAFLSLQETRLAMVLRLNILLRGYTGVRPILCERLADLINAGIYPLIPEIGSLGASGDLIPLAHLALPLIGEGDVVYEMNVMPAKEALKKAGLTPITFETKEGLALVNGTQIMLAVGGFAVIHGMMMAELADMAAALSYEGSNAHIDALDPFIHELRGHPGQIKSAEKILQLLNGSYLFHSNNRQRVQDPYSLRCAPQVHGASRDVLTHAADVVVTESNAVTDNPLVDITRGKILSGGNFHGQPLALAFDAAAMAVAELGNISERRIEVLLNPHVSGLPAFLAKDPGINSGLMTMQYLAGSLVNDSKVLASPASIDSIPGNVGIEDHVSMGMTAARKLRSIAENTKSILAIEFLVAAQAVDMRKGVRLGEGTTRNYMLLRKHVKRLDDDRLLYPDMVGLHQAVEEMMEADFS